MFTKNTVYDPHKQTLYNPGVEQASIPDFAPTDNQHAVQKTSFARPKQL